MQNWSKDKIIEEQSKEIARLQRFLESYERAIHEDCDTIAEQANRYAELKKKYKDLLKEYKKEILRDIDGIVRRFLST